jgi:hypothetical protein
MDEMVHSNDRSAIVTIAAILDDVITFAVGSKLPGLGEATKEEFEYAFRHEGPLGAFSSRIDMAFYLGAIGDTVRQQLHTIRHMRNSVAHTGRKVSFNDPALATVAKRVLPPTGLFKLLNDTPEGFRRSLVSEGLFLQAVILRGRETVIEELQAAYAKACRKRLSRACIYLRSPRISSRLLRDLTNDGQAA